MEVEVAVTEAEAIEAGAAFVGAAVVKIDATVGALVEGDALTAAESI